MNSKWSKMCAIIKASLFFFPYQNIVNIFPIFRIILFVNYYYLYPILSKRSYTGKNILEFEKKLYNGAKYPENNINM